MTGAFPDGRVDHLIRAILAPDAVAGHWAAYAACLGSDRPNEGEARLFPLVARNLAGRLGGVAMAERLQKSLAWARIRQTLSSRARAQIAERLGAAGIPLLWTKGTALTAAVYAPEEPRISMDVDVILRWPDVERVTALADAAGWVPKLAPPSFDESGALSGTELSYSIPGLVEVDFSWQPRMPFAFDPTLRDWLWGRRDPALAAQSADPTWLLLETLEHGLVANAVSPIRWVVDAVLLIRRCGSSIDWEMLADFAFRYRLVLPVRRGLETVRQYGADVPSHIRDRLEAHEPSPVETAEFDARTSISDINRNHQIASANNLLLRAGDGQLALLNPTLAPVSVLGLDLRARLERRLEQLDPGQAQTGVPAEARLVEGGQEAAQLANKAAAFDRKGRLALALMHWQAAAAAAPGDAALTLSLARAQAAIEEGAAACQSLAGIVAQFPDDPVLQRDLARRQIACGDHATALQTCNELVARDPDDADALHLRASCLHKLCRSIEALADLRRALTVTPNAPAARTRLARMLFDTGQHEEIVELARGLRLSNRKWLALHLLAARSALRLGRTAAADKLFARLQEVFPDDPSICRTVVAEKAAALDLEGALAIARDAVQAFPSDPATHGAMLGCLQTLGRFDELRARLDAVPVALRVRTSFQLGVMLPAYFRLRLVDETRNILVAQSRDGLPAELGLELVNALSTHGDLEESYARLTDLATRFPGNLRVQRKCVMIFGSRDKKTLDRTKAALEARLAPWEWCELLAPLDRTYLSPPERRKVTQWLLSGGGLHTAGQRRRFLLGFRNENDPERIRMLLESYKGPELFFEALKPALTSRLASPQSDALATGGATGHADRLQPGIAWSGLWRRTLTSLGALRQAGARRLVGRIPGLVATDPLRAHAHSRICLQVARIAGDHPLADGRLQGVLRRHAMVVADSPRESWMDSAESADAAAGLCDWLVARMAAKAPTSVIRLGDGEGNFLPYPEAIRSYQDIDRAEVQRDPWWGEELLDHRGQANLSQGLIAAIRGAEVLGIPNSLRYAANMGWPTLMSGRDTRGLEAIPCFLESAGYTGHFASCNLHTDLEIWNLYQRLLAGCGEVSVISCHDLAPILKARFDLAIRVGYRIPGEYRHSTSYASRYDGMATGVIYPDVFNEIMSSLAPRPGEVHLVGAGILGKLFCQRIKERGGIGIDIGSQADQWTGFRTRNYFAET